MKTASQRAYDVMRPCLERAGIDLSPPDGSEPKLLVTSH